MKKDVEIAVKTLNKGGVIIFPTDTAYGIGCRIDNYEAVRRLFKIRKRAENKAVPVLVSSVEMAQKYLMPISNEIKEKLIYKYWPGACTIILDRNKTYVPDLVSGGGSTLGVRMPDNDVIINIIENVGVPILAPSANFSGEKTPFTFGELDPELVKLVDYVISGECSLREASTVIDCSLWPWKILRQGGIKLSL